MIVDELNNIVTEFINDSNDVVRYLSLNAKSMKMFSIYEKNDWIIVDLKNPKIRFSPIAPFMDVLKSQELTKEKVEPYTYSLQNESFVSYFTKGKTEFRQDVIIMEELFYEKKRCIQTVLELIENYITKPIIILNSQELKEESISLIKLLENNKNLKSKFLFCFNFLEAGFDYESNTFFSEISEKNNYFDLSNVENSYDETVLDNPILVRKSYIVPFETLYNFFTASINFLSLTGGIAVAEKYLKDAIS
ncbi:MAG: hypothetical protein IIX47_07320, partial [Spirochaetaceae bacterium]|nr:hypothetical protein [Spirochaetaceae bacterium]